MTPRSPFRTAAPTDHPVTTGSDPETGEPIVLPRYNNSVSSPHTLYFKSQQYNYFDSRVEIPRTLSKYPDTRFILFDPLDKFHPVHDAVDVVEQPFSPVQTPPTRPLPRTDRVTAEFRFEATWRYLYTQLRLGTDREDVNQELVTEFTRAFLRSRNALYDATKPVAFNKLLLEFEQFVRSGSTPSTKALQEELYNLRVRHRERVVTTQTNLQQLLNAKMGSVVQIQPTRPSAGSQFQSEEWIRALLDLYRFAASQSGRVVIVFAEMSMLASALGNDPVLTKLFAQFLRVCTVSGVAVHCEIDVKSELTSLFDSRTVMEEFGFARVYSDESLICDMLGVPNRVRDWLGPVNPPTATQGDSRSVLLAYQQPGIVTTRVESVAALTEEDLADV